MAGQMTSRTTAAKTTSKNDPKTVTADATSPRPAEPVADASTARDRQPPQRPEPSPRTGVLVNVDSVEAAFASGTASQSVGYVQHVLRSRNLDPGEPTGVANVQTRTALAKFQESIGEPPTGVPTARTLDYLGFDVT